MVEDVRLIIGGVAQGKLSFAKELAMDLVVPSDSCIIVDETYIEMEELYNATIINHFHLIVRRLLGEGISISLIIEHLFQRNPKVIIVSTEIGYGIVPIEQFERTYREQTGRVCCTIAKEAQEVYRIMCGIPTKIK